MNGVGTSCSIATSLLSENNIEKERKMKKIFSCIAAVWMLASCDPVTDPVKATGIEIRPSSVTLEVGKTEELTFAVLPEQAVQKVLWESSNEKIVTVKEGKVTAIAAGKAEVKAVVAENKSLTAVCTVTVTAPVPETTPVTGLTPTPAVEQPVSLTVGGMQAFSVAVVPEDASNPAVNWSVDNGAVTLSAATGTSVTVTAASAGTAVVTAVSADNSEVSVSWKVTVTEPVPEEKPVTGLTPTPAVEQPVSLTVGGMQTFSVAVVPEDASNPAVNWSVDNEAVITLSDSTGTSVMVTAASAGTAVVTAVSADNGEVSVSWTVTVTDPVPESLNLEKDVSDAAFRAVLTQFDTNKDGIVSRAEADMVRELICEGWTETITDLTGIAFFTNLETLSVQGERLESVDLSRNKKLKHIDLSYNVIRELDLTALDQLEEYETNTGGTVVYGLQIGNQGKSPSYSDEISVILSDVYKDVWERTWSQPVSEFNTPNKGVTVTFR